MKELINFIQSPYNDLSAIRLADCYYEREQYAAALSFYLRVTECSKNDLLIYESLLKCGLCFEKQGNRTYYAKGMYQHAISVLPMKGEGYFLLSRLYERNKEWQESYTTAEIGLLMSKFEADELQNVEYPGKWGFLFEKSVVSWWMGREKESIELLLDLKENYTMSDEYKTAVENNIRFIWGEGWTKPYYYKKGMELIHRFDGMELINQNYSQAFQDLFILTALNGKKNGKYLELGSYHPFNHSNTYLLEEKFDWKGLSLEINPQMITWFNGKRKNECLGIDATKADYKKILDDKGWGTEWDYLQIDCEPAQNSMLALLQIPFDIYKFRVITFEHDYYTDQNKDVKEKSRRYLKSMGYELVVSDVSVDTNSPFEDWYLHAEMVDKETIEKLKSTNKINFIKELFLKNNNLSK